MCCYMYFLEREHLVKYNVTNDLIENEQNVEILLKINEMFLRMLTESSNSSTYPNTSWVYTTVQRTKPDFYKLQIEYLYYSSFVL